MKYFIILIILVFSNICFSQTDTSSIVDNEVYTIIDKMPSFVGDTMTKFIQANIKYPLLKNENSINGTCYITMVIEKDGSLSGIRILRSIPGCLWCDEEAIRVISIMPKWIPGTHRGKLKRVQYNLPIKFTLR